MKKFSNGTPVPHSHNGASITVEAASDLTVTGNQTITSSMTVGNLTVKGTAVLTIDYTSTAANSFEVQGNILVQDSAKLIVKGNQTYMNDKFTIANTYNSQYNMQSKGTSQIQLQNIKILTQTGVTNNIYMTYDAYDSSKLTVNNAQLDNSTSWLLANYHNSSILLSVNTQYVPTENYLNDSCDVTISGAQTLTGLWMSLTTGAHTINLPDVNNNFSWQANSNIGAGVLWHLTVSDANPGMGVLLGSNASATITGHGTPTSGELKIGYYVSNTNETLSNLNVGLQNGVIVPGCLALSNVNLGPIAWQIYSTNSSSLTINNSTINEIGVVSNGNVTVNDSVLQLAVLACYGQNSTLNINNCDVWNQSIEADSNSHITFTDCNVYGSLFTAKQAQSTIDINGGAFYDNPPVDPLVPMVNITTGYPNYNPFRAPGAPQKTGIGVITANGVLNCNW